MSSECPLMSPAAGSLIDAVPSRVVCGLLLVGSHRVNVTGAIKAGPGETITQASLTTGAVIWFRHR